MHDLSLGISIFSLHISYTFSHLLHYLFTFMFAAIMRKLNLYPELFKDEETLPKALRFALCAGIIAQWTIGSTKGLPTESASQNLTEQLYRPVFVQPLGNELYARRSQEYLL
jgi:hypothetical protein